MASPVNDNLSLMGFCPSQKRFAIALLITATDSDPLRSLFSKVRLLMSFTPRWRRNALARNMSVNRT